MDAGTPLGGAELFCRNMSGAHIVGGEQGEERRALGSGFDGGVTIHFLAIDQAQYSDDLELCVAGSFDGLDGRSARRAD